MESWENAMHLLPPMLRQRGQALPETTRETAEELRLRLGQPPRVLTERGEIPFPDCPPVTARQLRDVLELATGASVHTAEHSIRQGFVTVCGGLRIGLCGTVVEEAAGSRGLRELSSMAIRLPRAVRGCGAAAFSQLWDLGFPSTLLLSPPGGGKTTLLREWIRCLSERGVRVGLADARGEVAGVWRGRAQYDLGPCTDVLTGGEKAAGSIQLLRTMNPQLVAMDEITAKADVEAAEQIANCGVTVLATAHGRDRESLSARPLYRRLLALELFRYAVVISGAGSRRQYAVVAL